MTPQTGFALVNGAQLYYEMAGSGDTLVFVHAGIADHRLWDDQTKAFAAQYRVIRYDMRGFGKSEPVDGAFAHREDLAALLKVLNVDKAVLIGCSMGGGFAMDVALAQSQLVRALVMVCSAPNGLWLDVPTPMAALEEALEAALKNNDLDLAAEYGAQIWFDGVGRTPQQVDAVLRAKLIDMHKIALTHQAKALGTHKPPQNPAPATRLSELNLPVLAVVGAQDEPYIHAAGDYMAQHIKGARTVIIENTAHLPSMERPAEFNRILADFLASL
jgi:pimeloyl-ACP methyl ester carboxylesterase